MQWSKLKSRVKQRICPELRNRIDFHLTSYRASHDGADKVWITVDGKRVFTCKHYTCEWAETTAYRCGLEREQVKSVLREVEIHGPGDFGNAMRAYLDLPVAVALKSPDPLLQAFAIVDRRLGKRTLAKIEPAACQHRLVKAFYQLRCGSKES